MVTIKYLLSQTGRKASLLAGGNGERHQVATVERTHPAYPEAVALADVQPNGKAEITLATYLHYPPDGAYTAREYDAPQTAESLIQVEKERQAWLADREAKAEAKKVAEREARVAELLAAGPESLVYWTGVKWVTSREADDLQKHLGDLYQKAVSLAQSKTEAADAEKEAKAAAEKRAQAEQAARERAEIAAWAEQHGSPRLRRCVKESIPCRAIYRDERLALEYPGWEVDGKHLPTWDDARNPPEDALDLLDKARASLPADWTDEERAFAELKYWSGTDEYGDTTSGYAVLVEPGEWTDATLVYGYSGPRD